MKNLLIGFAALSIFAVAAASSTTGCGDDTSDGGGSDGGSSAGGNAGGNGTGGNGGSASCITCSDYTTAALAGMDPPTSTVCGYIAANEAEPGSSYELLVALGACVCDPDIGMCDTDCAGTCGDGTDTADCQTCRTTAATGVCSTEFNACTSDT